jgi:hypothetical protein
MLRKYFSILTITLGAIGSMQPVIASSETIHLSCNVMVRSDGGPLAKNSGGSFGLTLNIAQGVIEGDLYTLVSKHGVPFESSANRIDLISDKQYIAHFYWADGRGREQTLSTIIDRHSGDLLVLNHDKKIKSGDRPSLVIDGSCAKSKKLF